MPWQPGRTNELVETYELFTGGRAMSENLQLDRVLPRVQPNETPVKLDSLTGITIQEIDWKPLIKDAKPKLDPLAGMIPADQHVVFFPTFQAAVAMADETKPARHAACCAWPSPDRRTPASSSATSEQLGLPMSRWPGCSGRTWPRAWP